MIPPMVLAVLVLQLLLTPSSSLISRVPRLSFLLQLRVHIKNTFHDLIGPCTLKFADFPFFLYPCTDVMWYLIFEVLTYSHVLKVETNN